jgi:hypothetical protein
MFLIKHICIIIFIIITILFTIGYITQPIVSNYSTSITPTGTSNNISFEFYISGFDSIISNMKGTYTQNNEYSRIDNNKLLILKTLFYICISISIILVISIILALYGLKFISKILFFITLLLMVIVFLIIQISIVASSLITIVSTQQFTKLETSNGTGYYLILASTCLMFINTIIYMIFG